MQRGKCVGCGTTVSARFYEAATIKDGWCRTKNGKLNQKWPDGTDGQACSTCNQVARAASGRRDAKSSRTVRTVPVTGRPPSALTQETKSVRTQTSGLTTVLPTRPHRNSLIPTALGSAITLSTSETFLTALLPKGSVRSGMIPN
jgi:hypothetical protein